MITNNQLTFNKADDGERGIDTSDAANDPRPPRMNSAVSRRNSSMKKITETE